MDNLDKYLRLYKPVLTELQAIEEAARCLLCHDAPCSKGCPAGTNPAGFIRAIRFGNFIEAAQIITNANILGHSCGCVCPYKELCEKKCCRGEIDRPIDIGGLQNFALKYKKDISENVKNEKNGIKVAIIGSGPAGLSAAANLASKGYLVTVIEKCDKPGGILSYGIVPARLPIEIVDEEIDYIKRMGVKFVLNNREGYKDNYSVLQKKGYKAVLIAVGNQVPRRLEIPGSDLSHVFSAIDFLAESKSKKGHIEIGNNVIIIGGGDVAMDAASTAILLGAESVTILYRRRLQDMPASEGELSFARSLNVGFYTDFVPVEYVSKNGVLIGVKAEGKNDNSKLFIEADTVIEAVGQVSENLKSFLPIDYENNAINEEPLKTKYKGVFVTGDVTGKCNTVVEAVQMGKTAANSIDNYLCKKYNKEKKKIKRKSKVSLNIEFCGVECENPFFLSSSPVGHSYEMCSKALETGWGGIYYKTITEFMADECSPRFDALRKENTPFIGFKNMEQTTDRHYEQDFETIAKLKKNYPDKIIATSIMGENETQWSKLARLSEEAGADLIECNFSCPQMTVSGTGSDVGQNPDLIKIYTAAVRKVTKLPVIAKMTPNIGNMEIPAEAAVLSGADAISAINTIKSITAIDLDKFVCLPIVNGRSSISGYSGRAVKPVALRFIAQLAKYKKLSGIPLSGVGGIETWEDAVEFFMVGASNLQVATAVMQYGYRIVEDLKSGMMHYLEKKGFKSINEIIGLALKNILPAEDLDRDFKVYPSFDVDKCVGCGRCYISCFDGAHQAIIWNEEKRKPELDKDKCVGCHLCLLVCPVKDCIKADEIVFKEGRKKHKIIH
ncbi:MAG: NAD-dependent dihydropyrimidine dehydrogenase subunit PreA [bacterium]|nr:NAD-dependent dihydropyrimidine dehydrogenase subunit PreA [bacterium]